MKMATSAMSAFQVSRSLERHGSQLREAGHPVINITIMIVDILVIIIIMDVLIQLNSSSL